MTDKKILTEPEVDNVAGGVDLGKTELLGVDVNQKSFPFGPPPKPVPNPFADK